jgi:hypothetical protein
MTQVYTEGGWARTVPASLSPAEVAGKVLPPRAGLWRTAVREGRGWLATYHQPSDEEVQAWENRRKSREAKTTQPNFAHR